jgi:hypothetical protein
MRFTVPMGNKWGKGCAAFAALVAVLGTAAPAGAAPGCRPAPGQTACTIELGPAPLGAPGQYARMTFSVPRGVGRIDAAFPAGEGRKIGLGLFDERGSGWQSPGFRGIAGEERKSVFIASQAATPGFVAGAIRRGTWTAIVPNFLAVGDVRVEVTLTFGRRGATPSRQPVPELVRAGGGWFKGDLHVHTTESSDAESSGRALTPAQMALRAQARGLDFVNLSDHNVTTQNDRLRDASPPGFLLMGGEEVTTWQGGPGHMTAAGLQAGQWLDWRFKPRLGRYANWQAWTPDDRPVQDAIAKARSFGAYVSANHPFVAPGFGSDWGFFEDSDADLAALPDGLEVWNDDFWLTFSFAAIARWDQEIARGRHVCGNGGSDVHSVGGKTEVGSPTTVVYAPELSRAAIVDAMKRCRMFITDRPTTMRLTLTAKTAAGEAMLGSTVSGPADAAVPVTARAERASGKFLHWIRNGETVWIDFISSDDFRSTRSIAIGKGGGVRTQIHDFPLNLKPRALTNPIFLRAGAPGLEF